MTTARFREPVSGFTHLIGALLASIGLIWLIWVVRSSSNDLTLLAVILIYGLSTIATFLASTVMHLFGGSKTVFEWLVRIDHAAIYLMIAGTYTHFSYAYVEDPQRSLLLALIWGLALAGIIYKLWWWQCDSWRSTLSYLAMGWLALLLLPQVWGVIQPGALILTVLGGLAYTLGAFVFGLRWPNFNEHWGFHEIWHLFVLAGAACHYFAIAFYIV